MLLELLTSRYPGMRQWLMQRLSATLMAVYLLLLVLRVLMLSPTGFTQWQTFFPPLWWRALTWLFFALMLLHAWIGVRDVLRDYVSHLKTRTVLQLLVDASLLVDLIWLSRILWNI